MVTDAQNEYLLTRGRRVSVLRCFISVALQFAMSLTLFLDARSTSSCRTSPVKVCRNPLENCLPNSIPRTHPIPSPRPGARLRLLIFYTDYRPINPAMPRASACVCEGAGRAGRRFVPPGYCSGGWPAGIPALQSRNPAVWQGLMSAELPRRRTGSAAAYESAEMALRSRGGVCWIA